MSPFLTLVEGVFFGVRFRPGCLVQWFLCWFSWMRNIPSVPPLWCTYKLTQGAIHGDNTSDLPEKSDEFITCIFLVVLGIERRMGYQVKACSNIFCLSENLPLGVIVLGSARACSWCPPLPVPAKTSTAKRPTSTWIAKLTVKTWDFGYLWTWV